MSTTAVHTHAGFGVQPHPLYSISGAALGTALVCTLLLWAFTHPLPNTPAQLMQLSLVAIPASQSKPVTPSPARHILTPRSVTAKPVVMPEATLVKPVPSLAHLDLSLPGLTFVPPAVSAYVPHLLNSYSDLARALNAPSSPSSMHNGDAYRSEYGSDLVKADGRCLALETVQIGPSPSAHATVGFGVPCPGEYRPSMADELKAWADKQAAKTHGGP